MRVLRDAPHRRPWTRALTRRVVIASVCIAMMGCSTSLIELPEVGPPPARYELSAPPSSRACASGVEAHVLVIEHPSVRASLAGDRIVVRWPSGEVRSLAGARWASPMPAMLQHVLMKALGAGCLDVTAEPLGLDEAYRLSTEVLRFDALGDPDGLRSVEIELRASLIGGRPLRVVDQRHFAASAPIADADVDSVIAAFDAALDEVSSALRTWTSDTLRAQPSVGGSPKAP